MGLALGSKATLTLRFWKVSLAWKNIGDWAKGWNCENFANEVRVICNDNGALGLAADRLLDDYIHNRERSPNDIPGKLYSFPVTQVFSQPAQAIA